jgi:opacity protein-like surface antigen
MTRSILRGTLGLIAVACLVFGASAGHAADDEGVHLYLSAHGGVSFGEGESGGFNNLGPHPNTGDDNHDSSFGGGAFGVAVPVGPVTLRVEAEGTGQRSYTFTTESFEPPTPTFFYDVDISGWSAMANLWVDVPLPAGFSLTAGGGLGAAFNNLDVTDGVVRGSSKSDTEFS